MNDAKHKELPSCQLDATDLDERRILFVNINQLQLGLLAYVDISVGCHCKHVWYALQLTNTQYSTADYIFN